MNWPNRIVLVRHGESEGNVKSLEDLSFENKANHAFVLTGKGKAQAATVGKYLKSKYGNFDAYFCSTFCRTHETLAGLYPEARPIIDSRLNETWRGVWHTMSKDRISKLYPDEERIKDREGLYHYRAPGGQSGQDVDLMIHSFLHTLRADYGNKNILISAHGNWLLFFWRVMLGLPISEYERRYREDRYKNCSVTVYEQVKGEMILVEDNFVL